MKLAPAVAYPFYLHHATLSIDFMPFQYTHCVKICCLKCGKPCNESSESEFGIAFPIRRDGLITKMEATRPSPLPSSVSPSAADLAISCSPVFQFPIPSLSPCLSRFKFELRIPINRDGQNVEVRCKMWLLGGSLVLRTLQLFIAAPRSHAVIKVFISPRENMCGSPSESCVVCNRQYNSLLLLSETFGHFLDNHPKVVEIDFSTSGTFIEPPTQDLE